MERIPYSKDELNIVNTFPSMFPGRPPTNQYNTPVTPRENYLAAVRREKPLWIPKAGDSVTLIPRVVPDNVARALIFDAEPLTDEERVGGKDMFGIDWVYVPVAGGSMVKPGDPTLKDANDWETVIKFPNIDELDWEYSAKSNAQFINTGRATIVWIMNGLYERLISFMDFDQAVMALIDEDQKDAVLSLFDKLADLYDQMIEKFKTYYNADILLFHDDWGSQRAPFFSVDTVREMILPSLKKVINSCHKRGMLFELHSCGKNELLVPAMIEAGVDIWNGQPMNDKFMLYDQYGDKITLAFDSGYLGLAAEATPEEAEKLAKDFVAKYGPNFFNAPVITSQGLGPEEFSKTIYEESRILFNNM